MEFVFIFVFLILLFMGLTFLGIEQKVIWNNLSIWTVMVIAFLLLLIGITQVYSDVFTPYAGSNVTKTIGSETLRTLFHPRVLGAIFILIITAYPSIILLEKAYNFIKILIPGLLILVSFFMISTERKIKNALIVFLLTGILGLAVLNIDFK